MNQIENEQIKFFFEHEERIREWAGLETEVIKFVDQFYRSLKGDLDAALRDEGIADSDVESLVQGGDWPGLGLRRQGWPKGDENADVRLQWHKSACFPPHGHLICGACTGVKKHKVPFTKEARPEFPYHGPWWAAFKNVDPPVGRFWEGDNLKEYRSYLVETILKAWKDLAPLVDKAVGHRSS